MAVFTPLAFDEITHFLAQYDLPALSAALPIAQGTENTNYKIVTREASFILTLFEKRVASQDLPFFASLMEHLQARSIPCPLPVRARDGRTILPLKGKSAMLVTFLPGAEATALTEAHSTQLGELLARMHLAGRDFSPARRNSVSLPEWRLLLARILPILRTKDKDMAEALATELARIEASWPESLPSGVIHADIFPDNVFFDEDGQLCGVIDFYFACHDYLAYELAVALNAWCMEVDGTWRPEMARALLCAYETRRPLEASERAALPTLLRAAALRFFLTRAHDLYFPAPKALVTPKDPLEYWRKLETHRRTPFIL